MSADEEFNPYSHSTVSDVAEDVTGARTPGPFAVLFVVIASIVAAGTAFFCTCLGFVAADVNGRNWGGAIFFVIGLFTLLAYMLTAKFGLSIMGGMASSSRAAPARNASWPVIFLSACLVAAIFFGCILFTGFWGILWAACAAIGAGTFVIWKLPQLKKDVAGDGSAHPDGAGGASNDTPSSFGDAKHED
jgi:hypothetical protein